ncbi:MAG: ExbD/TolR family protein [Bdellovibrionales bacterium]
MSASTQDSDQEISDINIVPLVDIILVVLIIFMVTAPAMLKPSFPVQLPEASGSETSEPSFLNVTITEQGQVMINGQVRDEVQTLQLAKEQLEKNPKIQAVITADRRAYHESVIQAMDWLKKAGVSDFAVTTERKIQ